MRHPKFHKFLVWAGRTSVIFAGGCLALIATYAQTYGPVKDWAQNQFEQWRPLVTAPWFLATVIVVVCFYIGATIYTGSENAKDKASTKPVAGSPPSRAIAESDFYNGISANPLEIYDHGSSRGRVIADFRKAKYHRIIHAGNVNIEMVWPDTPGFQSGILELVHQTPATIGWPKGLRPLRQVPSMNKDITTYLVTTTNSGKQYDLQATNLLSSDGAPRNQRAQWIAKLRTLIAGWGDEHGHKEQRRAMEKSVAFLSLRKSFDPQFLEWLDRNALVVIDGKRPDRPSAMARLSHQLDLIEEAER